MKIILAIDDQKDNLITINAVIKSHLGGCIVLTALSGKEGIEIAREQQPDAILLDIIMPEMDGYETCRRLKADERTRHIPVVMVTAIKTDSQSRVKGLNTGADAFLSKPIDPVELSAQVNVMLRIKEAEDKLRAEKVVLEDIVSERTQELKINEEKWRSLTQNSPDNIMLLDTGYIIRFVNHGIRGYSKDEIIGKSFFDFAPASFHKIITDTFTRVFQSRKPDKYEIKYDSVNGDSEYFDVRISALTDKSGEISGFISNATNVTEHIRNIQIQQVLYNISNAVVTTDNLQKLIGLVQKELGAIIDTTNFYIALYNSDNNTLSLPFFADEKDDYSEFPAGKTLTYYVIKSQNPLLATREKLSELKESGEIEFFGSESEIWLGVPLKVKGKITGVLAVQSYTNPKAYSESDLELLVFISDQISISIDRKKTEEELLAALKKAEESDRLKSAFLANMSHEIRTPMNGILGFADLLKEPDLNGEEQKRYLQIIERSGERMLNIINDIVDISKIESGQMEIVFSNTNINDQLEYLYTFFSPEANKRGLKLSVTKISSRYDSEVITDREKIYAILTNLIKNALKFTHEGNIEFGCLKQDGFLEFYVKDTGIGVPDNRQQAIFERFVQADIEDQKVYEGAGLGLSISKAYVDMLGGTIWLKSAEGIGSEFYFTIPFLSSQNNEQKIVHDSLPVKMNQRGKKLNILIAEDEETADLHLSIALKDIAGKLYHANTGAKAVEFCRNNQHLDIVLMDIKMPEMDGYEATRKIREFNKSIPIIAQTAYALTGDKEKVFEAGCNDYISKPINRNELLEKIQMLIGE